MADARRLIEVGFVPPLAQELAAQIEAGVGNARRLIELGVVPPLAALIVAAIAGTFSPGKFAELGLSIGQIIELIKQLRSSGISILGLGTLSILGLGNIGILGVTNGG